MMRSRKTKRQKEDKARRLNFTYGAKRVITPLSEDSGSLFIKSLRMVKSNWKLFFIIFLIFSMPLLGLAFANLFYARRNNERTDPGSLSPCASYRLIGGELTNATSVYWVGAEHADFDQPKTINDCLEILSKQQSTKRKKIAIVTEAVPAGRKIDCSFMGLKGERCFGGDTKAHVEWSEERGFTYIRGQQLKVFLQEYNNLARNEARFTNYIKEQMKLTFNTLNTIEASSAHIDPKAYNTKLAFKVYENLERDYLIEKSRVQIMKELLAHSKNGSRYIDFFTENKHLIAIRHPKFDLMTNVAELFNRHDSFYNIALDLSKEYIVFFVLGKNHLRSQKQDLKKAANYLIEKLKSSASKMPFFAILYQFRESSGCSSGLFFNETEFKKSGLCIFAIYMVANLIALRLLFVYENEWNYIWAHELETPSTLAEHTAEESSMFIPS